MNNAYIKTTSRLKKNTIHQTHYPLSIIRYPFSSDLHTFAAFYKLPVALFANVFSPVDDHPATRQYGFDNTLDLHSLIGIVVDVHVMRVGGNCLALFRVKDDDVRIRTDGDRPFLGNIPNIFAAAVDVISTNRLSEIRFSWTPPL